MNIETPETTETQPTALLALQELEAMVIEEYDSSGVCLHHLGPKTHQILTTTWGHEDNPANIEFFEAFDAQSVEDREGELMTVLTKKFREIGSNPSPVVLATRPDGWEAPCLENVTDVFAIPFGDE